MALVTHTPADPRRHTDYPYFLQSTSPEDVEITQRRMVAEWFPQSGVQLTWPHAGTDWADMLDEVNECYLRLAYAIATRTTLLIATPEPEEVRRLLAEKLPQRALNNVVVAECPTDDTWARDHAPLSVMGPQGTELLDFRFNGWGGKFEAENDNAITRHLYEQGYLQGTYVDCLDFELEGGSIESDGRGTLLTTSQCLLNPNRNPQYNREQIEEILRERLGADRVLWLDHGYMAGDDTDSHIDTLARLCPSDTILYVSCADAEDEHYEALRSMEQQLQSFRTADNQPYRLVALPMAPAIFDGPDRLPATYANYLVMDTAVLYPTYGCPETDEQARQAIAKAFPKYELVGIDCCALIRQHGSLHCATMQYPRGVVRSAEKA